MELDHETADLRERIAQASRIQTETAAQRDQWKTEAGRFQKWAEEVHQLRAETSRLRGELSQARTLLDQIASGRKRAGASDETRMAADTTKSSDGKRKKTETPMPLESAPPAVGATITKEMGGGQLRVLVQLASDDENAVYAVKGQLADGRAVGMRVAEDGRVLEKSTEVASETLPARIQKPISETFGDIKISGARQIVDGDNISYEVVSKSPDMGMQITVRDDGTILGYSAKVRTPEPKGE